MMSWKPAIMASISDDDLCSDCRHCEYRPGDDSGCVKDFPGETNPDGYVIRCEWFIGILHPGDNWSLLFNEPNHGNPIN